jgi:hypothetical protein
VPIVAAFIASLKVALTVRLTHTPTAASAAFVDVTVGATVSTAVLGVVGGAAASSLSLPQPATKADTAKASSHAGGLKLLWNKFM